MKNFQEFARGTRALANRARRVLGSRHLPPLPESFLFGVATADHQCEAYVPGLDDTWDVWEQQPGVTPRQRATEFWERYPEDIERARQLGCTAFRFSIAWARVEPRPGEFDDAAFDHYRQVVATIREAGLEPIVTLLHFVWPAHLEQRGGLLADDFPTHFERYATETARQLGDAVRYWIPINEPNGLVYGYIKPWWQATYASPPGLPPGTALEDQVEAVGTLIRHLFQAHTAARIAIRRENPTALVGSNPLPLGLPPWLRRWIDGNAERLASHDALRSHTRRYATRPLAERGDVDAVVATLTRTPERGEKVAFSRDYYVAGQTLLTRADSDISKRDDLNGRTVVVVRGSTAERDASRLLPTARLLHVDDYGAALNALDTGTTAAVLADDAILKGIIARHPECYRLVGGRLTHEPYAVAVPQGNRDLLDAVNRAVQGFVQSGQLARSHEQHLGQPVPTMAEPTPGALAESQPAHALRKDDGSGSVRQLSTSQKPSAVLRRIRRRGYLVVGVRPDVPGFGYRDPRSGTFQGLEIDLAREIARQILGDPDKVRFRAVTTAERIPLLCSLLRLFNPLLKLYSIVSTGISSDWWELGQAGRLSTYLCPKGCDHQQDFVGFDYYWGIRSLRIDRLSRLVDATARQYDRAPVWPRALYDLLRYYQKIFPNLPVLIVENGSVEQTDGVDRSTYLRRHVHQVQRAVRDGVNVIGYICWSITSNREWGTEFGPANDFGLYHIDLDTDPTLARKATPAERVYREIIARRSG